MPKHVAKSNSKHDIQKAVSQNMHELNKAGATPRSHAQQVAIAINEAKPKHHKKK